MTCDVNLPRYLSTTSLIDGFSGIFESIVTLMIFLIVTFFCLSMSNLILVNSLKSFEEKKNKLI